MWIIYALFSALLAATRRTNEKQLTYRLNHFTIAFATQLFSLPIILIALLISGRILNPLHLSAGFWIPLLVIGIGFYPLSAFLYLQSIKHSELSKVLPIQSLWPVLSLIPAWLTLKQVPGIISTFGIILTFVGVYVLSMKSRTLHHPLQPFREEKGSRYMLFQVILVTVAGILDKIAINASSPIYYSFLSSVAATIVLFITLRVCKVNELKAIKQFGKNLGLIGTLQGTSYTSFLLAISVGPVAYVSAIRSTNILIGSVLGIVQLNESLTRYKLASFTLILMGGALLALGS